MASVARAHTGLLLTGVLLGLLGVGASLAQPWAIGNLIEAAGGGASMTGPVAQLVGLFCAGALFSSLQAYVIGRAGENIVFDVRKVLVGRLLRADLTAFAKESQGDIFTRTVTDTSLARIALAQSLAQLIVSGATVIGGVVLMFLIDLWLMVITTCCLGAASIISVTLARKLRKAALRNRDDTGAFAAGIQRVLSALPTVKASRAESREAARIGELAERTRRSGIRVNAYNALLMPSMNVGTQGALAVVVGVGMSWVARGEMDMASLTTFIMYLFQLVSPLVMLFMGVGQFVQGRAAIQRVDELARLPQEGDAPGGAAGLAPLGQLAPHWPAVEFHDVRFSYRRGRQAERTQVLNGVSFSVPTRGLTAVVGPSGAGKTTMFQLIERFYPVDGGLVRLGGQNVEALPLDTVRGLVGYVQQDSTALRGTIRENLTYANPHAGEDAVREAVEMAGLTSVIAQLPHGLDTELGDQGSGLSGGQRQRLCIARTLLQRPAVMLLDEATSNLDSDSERDFREVLRRVSRRCAVIAIAHRISTVVDADQIVVMEGGRVRATGVHHDLMERDELYRRLAGSQLRAEPGPVAPAPRQQPVEPWSPPPSIAVGWPSYAGLTEQTLQLRPIKSEEQW
ncbi:lipid A export permease/ATP-binding protein MsbA [Streptomyces viridochromogenes DSM 40736]|uniref:Lipid A export permease/ATP-binding protein MsbA n=1 Tax=Streptomyces viridochromogenes (strain DSM 40736 / JCM 4977 / BCRC 1201 / Tue 494) TaxID=591159 RepID=D9X5A3_STRVT|nr:lipid A export permease/ATP-binding protein MsbA [Streptomyces viridochromogenes DSM 40736]